MRGAHPLHVHGTTTHYYRAVAECRTACHANVGCVGFVDMRTARPPFCAFKKAGASRGVIEKVGRDYWAKRSGDEASNPPLRLLPLYTPPSLPSTLWKNRTGVHYVKGFVSRAEASALRELAARCFRRKRGGVAAAVPSSGAATTETDTVGSGTCAAGEHLALLSAVEARIAQLTGLPWHEEEEGLMLTRQVAPEEPSFADYDEEAEGEVEWLDPSRVHHDRVNERKEHREVTVLVYLSSREDAEGGHTIFPFLPPRRRPRARAEGGGGGGDDDDDAHLPSLAQMARTVRGAYARGVRSLGCHTCAQRAAVAPTAAEQRAMDAAHRHAEDECARATLGPGEGRALAVRPTLGTALVWWHTKGGAASEADELMWHAGCLARSTAGAGRWALQKFKAPPAAEGRRHARETEPARVEVTPRGEAAAAAHQAEAGGEEAEEAEDVEVDEELAAVVARAVGYDMGSI